MMKLNSTIPELPSGWIWTNIRAICSNTKNAIVDGPFGTQMKVHEFQDAGIPVIEMQNLKGQSLDLSFRRYITQKKFSEVSRSRVTGNDIIISKTGTLGQVSIVPSFIEDAIITSRLAKISLDTRVVELLYSYYFLLYLRFMEYWEQVGKGTTMKVLTIDNIASALIPLPPLPEQHRIVTKIEELFTRLDAGVDALKKIKTQLKQYRQAVLNYAFEGKLTEEWREAHKHELEPASVLLERIKEEGKNKANGKAIETPSIDTPDLPELPDGWTWARVAQVAEVGTGSTPLKSNKKYYENGDVPWVTSGLLNKPFVTYCNEMITKTALRETNAKVFPINTLLVAMYGEGKTRGKVSELMIEAATNQACAAILFDGTTSEIRPFIKMFFLKNYDDIRKLSSGGVQPNLNLLKVKMTVFPFPPLLEQFSIVKEVERHFSIADKIEKTIEQSFKQSERLRQSILKRAFEGKLVPQDPNDEPAEVLLERIKAEKEAQETERKPQKRDRIKRVKAQGRLI